MLYVAIWYVSIRYEGEGRTAVAQHVSDFNSPSSGAFLCCILQFGMSRYVMMVKEELLAHAQDVYKQQSNSVRSEKVLSGYVVYW